MAKGDKWRQFKNWFYNTGVGQWFGAKTGQTLSAAEQQANAFNAEEAQKARDWEEQQYLKYEAPKAMMDQYQAAGLNPALMYEGYSPSAPMTDVSANSVSPDSEAPIMRDIFGLVSGAMNLKMSMDKNRADISLIDAQKRNIESDTTGKDIDNSNKQRGYDLSFRLTEAEISEINQALKESDQRINESLQRIKESDVRIDEANKRIEVAGKQIELMDSEKELNIAKKFVEELNAEKMRKLMPYVESYQEAVIALTNAQTEKEQWQAQDYCVSSQRKILDYLLEEKLIDEGYYGEMIKQMKNKTGMDVATGVVGMISDIAVGVGLTMTGAGALKGLRKGAGVLISGASGISHSASGAYSGRGAASSMTLF